MRYSCVLLVDVCRFKIRFSKCVTVIDFNEVSNLTLILLVCPVLKDLAISCFSLHKRKVSAGHQACHLLHGHPFMKFFVSFAGEV